MDRRAFLGSLAGVFAVPLAARAAPRRPPPLLPDLRSGHAADALAPIRRVLSGPSGPRLRERPQHHEQLPLGGQQRGPVPGPDRRVSETQAPRDRGHHHPRGAPRSSWSRWETLSGPSENITGMSLMVPQLAVKRLELLKELVPGLSRVRVLSVLADPIALIQVKAMEAAAGPLHVALQIHDIRTADDIPTAFAEAHRAHAEGVVVTEESMFAVHRARLTELAAQNRMPAVYPFPLPVTDAGGLMAYTVKASELYRNAAVYVDRILRGTRVVDLPVQQPTQFELVINLRTARTLGLAIPPSLLQRADRVIE